MTTQELKEIPLFHTLEEEVLARLLPIIEVRTFPLGAEIFIEGDKGEELFLIRRGRVEIVKRLEAPVGPEVEAGIGTEGADEEGDEGDRVKELTLLKDGDFFGEMALLEGEVRSASARAQTESELWVIDREPFNKLLHENTRVAAALLFTMIGSISGRLRRTSEELVAMFETGRVIGSVTDINDLARQVTQISIGVIASDFGLLFLRDPLTGLLMPRAWIGPPGPNIEEATVEDEPGLLARLMEEREAVIENQLTASPPGPWPANLACTSLIAVPLLSHNEALGGLILGRQGGDPYTEDHLHLLRGIAFQVGPAVTNRYFVEEQQALSRSQRRYIRF